MSGRPIVRFCEGGGEPDLVGDWIAGDGLAAERAMLARLGAALSNEEVQAPETVRAAVARLPRGQVVLLPGTRQLVPGRPIVGATIRMQNLRLVQGVLANRTGQRSPTVRARRRSSAFVPPDVALGMWLEFREER